MSRRCRGWAEFVSEPSLDLIVACRNNDFNAAERAIASGAAINTADHDNNGNTPLHYAVLHDSMDLLCLFLQHPKIMLLPNAHSCSAVHLAAQYGSSTVMLQLLLRTFGHHCMADIDSRENTSLHLLMHNTKMDETDVAECTRSILKVTKGTQSLFRAKNTKGQTPLDVAVTEGPRTVQLQQTLLAFGARRAALWDHADRYELFAIEAKRRKEILHDEDRMWQQMEEDLVYAAAQWGEWMNVRREHLRRVELNMQTIEHNEEHMRRDLDTQQRTEHAAFLWIFTKELMEVSNMAFVRQQDSAAVRIQKRWRGIAERARTRPYMKDVRERRRRLKTLIPYVQRASRAFVIRRKCGRARLMGLRRFMAAIRIQRLWRGNQARHVAEHLRLELEDQKVHEVGLWCDTVRKALRAAVAIVVRFLREAPDRKRFVILRRKCIKIQGWWRARVSRWMHREVMSKIRSACIVRKTLKRLSFRILVGHQVRLLRREGIQRRLHEHAEDVAAWLHGHPITPVPYIDFHFPKYQPPKRRKKEKEQNPWWMRLYEVLVHLTLLAFSCIVFGFGWSPAEVYFDIIGICLIGVNLLALASLGWSRLTVNRLAARLFDVLCVVLGCMGVAGMFSQGTVVLYTLRLPPLLEPSLKVIRVLKEFPLRCGVPVSVWMATVYVGAFAYPQRSLAEGLLSSLLGHTHPDTIPPFTSSQEASTIVHAALCVATEFAWMGCMMSCAVRFAIDVQQTLRKSLVRSMHSELEALFAKYPTFHDMVDWEGDYALGSGLNTLQTTHLKSAWEKVEESLATVSPDRKRSAHIAYATFYAFMIMVVFVDVGFAIISPRKSPTDIVNLVFLAVYLFEPYVLCVIFWACREAFPIGFCICAIILRAVAALTIMSPGYIPLRAMRVIETFFFFLSMREHGVVRLVASSLFLFGLVVWSGVFVLHCRSQPLSSLFGRSSDPIVIGVQLVLKFIAAPLAASLACIGFSWLNHHSLLLQAYVRLTCDKLWTRLHLSRSALIARFDAAKRQLSRTPLSLFDDRMPVFQRPACVPTAYKAEIPQAHSRTGKNHTASDYMAASMFVLSRVSCVAACVCFLLGDAFITEVTYLAHVAGLGLELTTLGLQGRFRAFPPWYIAELLMLVVIVFGIFFTQLRPTVYLRLLTSLPFFVFPSLKQVLILLLHCRHCIGVLGHMAACIVSTVFVVQQTEHRHRALHVATDIIAQPHVLCVIVVGGIIGLQIFYGEVFLAKEAYLWQARLRHFLTEGVPSDTPLLDSFFIRLSLCLCAVSALLHLTLNDIDANSTIGVAREAAITGLMFLCILGHIVRDYIIHRALQITPFAVYCLVTDVAVGGFLVASVLKMSVADEALHYAFAFRVLRLVYVSPQQAGGGVLVHFVIALFVLFVTAYATSLFTDVSIHRVLRLVVEVDPQDSSLLAARVVLRVLFGILLAGWVYLMDHMAVLASSEHIIPRALLAPGGAKMVPRYLLRHQVLQLHQAGYPNIPHPEYCRGGYHLLESLVHYIECHRRKLMKLDAVTSGRASHFHTSSLILVLHMFIDGLPVLCPQQGVHWLEILQECQRHWAATFIQSCLRTRWTIRYYCHRDAADSYLMSRVLLQRTCAHRQAKMLRFFHYEGVEQAMLAEFAPILKATTWQSCAKVPRTQRPTRSSLLRRLPSSAKITPRLPNIAPESNEVLLRHNSQPYLPHMIRSPTPPRTNVLRTRYSPPSTQYDDSSHSSRSHSSSSSRRSSSSRSSSSRRSDRSSSSSEFRF